MARQRGLIKLQGTIAGLSFVKSTAYGDHVRAARGTYKKARVNAVLKANSEKAHAITKAGSPILKQLKTLEPGFHPGDLWARMMRCMHKANSTSVEDLLESLKGLEVNEHYAFGKLFAILPKQELLQRKGRLIIEMAVTDRPLFPRDVKAKEYLCEASVLFLNGKGGCTMDRMETEWISFDGVETVYEMDFAIPKGAKYFLVVCGVRGGREGRTIEAFAAKGYMICKWGGV